LYAFSYLIIIVCYTQDHLVLYTKMHNILCVLILISSAICILLWILFETRTQQKELKQKWIRTTRVIWK